MDEPTELLVATVKTWTNKYAHKIYVREKDEEKKEHHYDVVFFKQKPNESVPKCTVKVHFVITELEILDLGGIYCHTDLNEKYFITFKFENENLTRTLDMHLNFEKWINKLIKDKEKLRNKVDLSSDYIKSRFVKPVDEENIEKILKKIKEEREEKRKKDIKLEKSDLIPERILDTSASLKKKSDKKKLEVKSEETDANKKLNEALSFLRNVLYDHFTDIDHKKTGKVRHDMFVENLKMINYQIYFSFLYANEQKKESNEEENDSMKTLETDFYFEEVASINNNSSSSSSSNSSSSNSSSSNSSSNNEDFPEEISDESYNRINKRGVKIEIENKKEKEYLSNLFSMNNNEIDLIKDINIYKNEKFNGFNFFSKSEIVTSLSSNRNCNFFVFDKSNPYYSYLYTDNPYDFLLYTAFAYEDDSGFINYKIYVNLMATFLYEIKKNRELFITRSLDELTSYKHYMFICYENEMNFMSSTIMKHFQKYDPNFSGFIHRNKLKMVLKENDHIISNQEYKLLLRVLDFNDDNYIYYKNFKETILRLRFEAIKNSIFERDAKLLYKYLCKELVKYNFQNKRKLHIFDCKNILDACDKIYLSKNAIHIILSSLSFDVNLEMDTTLFLQICVTIIVNMVKLEKMQMIYNVLSKEKEKKDKTKNSESTIVYKQKKDSKFMEKVSVPALELVEQTLTKLFKVLDEKNEDLIDIKDFVKILLESNKQKKVIDIKEICKFSTKELQGFVAEINTQSLRPFYEKNIKNKTHFEYGKNKKIHYLSHIHKWCTKTYQIGSCYYYSYFMNYAEPLIELDENITNSLLFCAEKKKE